MGGGVVDAVLMRVVDLVLVVPKVPLLIVIGTYAGPGLTMLSLIIALTGWPPTARIVRAQVLSLRRRAHIKAAVGFGGTPGQILRRHILPEVGLILAAGLVGAAGRAITFEAGLAFLGLGDPSPGQLGLPSCATPSTSAGSSSPTPGSGGWSRPSWPSACCCWA